MKLNQQLAVLLIATGVAFTACKKDAAKSAKADVELTSSLNGDTILLATGKTLSITLGNPGDGGYSFNDVQFAPTVLKLNGHKHTEPDDSDGVVRPGNWGKDSWSFTTLKPGASVVKITASRFGKDTVEIFNGVINVK